MPKRSRKGPVSRPARVVAPTSVNGGRSILLARPVRGPRPAAPMPAAGAETHDAASDGCSGVVALAKELDNRPVKRLALELVALADVDAHQHPFTLQAVHIPSRDSTQSHCLDTVRDSDL